MKRTRCVFLLVFAAALALGSDEYDIETIPPPAGYNETHVNAINNQRIAVGSTFGPPDLHLGYFFSDGVLSGILPGSPYVGTHAFGISSDGHIVGERWTGAQNGLRAYVYWNGVTTALPSSDNATARAINLAGVVVGWRNPQIGSAIPVKWVNGLIQTLHWPYSTGGLPLSINEAGDIVGYEYPEVGPTKPIAWLSGVATRLQLPQGATGGQARDINNSGIIVGQTSGANTLATLWGPNGPVLLDGLGAANSNAMAITDGGDIVGSARTLSPLRDVATLWRNGQPLDLNTTIPLELGWWLFAAFDMNDHGQIVGWGNLNNRTLGFVLTPVFVSRPSSYELVHGTLVSGQLSSLNQSDNNYLIINPDLNLSRNEKPIDVIFRGTTAVLNPWKLKVRIESHTPGTSVTQRVALLNVNTHLWEEVDSRTVPSSDVSADIAISGGPARFVASDGALTARVTYQQAPNVSRSSWPISLDVFQWRLNP